MQTILLTINNGSSISPLTIFAMITVVSIASIYYFKRTTTNSQKNNNNNDDNNDKNKLNKLKALGRLVVKEWTITKVQHEYIHKIAKKFKVDISSVVTRLIVQANKEDNKRKKFIFRVVRCDNCSQSSTGGYKVDVELELDLLHTKWLDNVHIKCNHASVDKTLRIILDFYIGVVLKDGEMENRFFDFNE